MTDQHGKRSRSNKYSDFVFETCLRLRFVFNLPLRALEGIVNSLLNLMYAPIQSPKRPVQARNAA
ncbi:transposase [Pseudoalteromonas luteoviolacea]|uniref:transposase n=1 Tax=Pseudoalteromonas luteoviolacea TaxID=43657 RepID=UPI0009BD903A|nr:transposase [Pseudoalteromonas luteoviolacea]